MTEPTSLLSREAHDAARALALDWLGRISTASLRVRAEPNDVEGVHATRVAITRLRATLRVYRGSLGKGLGRRGARELRQLNRALGRVRDLDVQLEWLAAHQSAFTDAMRPGADWLLAHLLVKRDNRARRIGTALTRHFDIHVERWQHALTNYTVARVVGEVPQAESLAAVVVQQLHHAVHRIERSLRLAAETAEPELVHAARISIKRVRALLVPWLSDVPALQALYGTLSRAQDTVGAMRDAHLLAVAARRATMREPLLADSLNALAEHLDAASEAHGAEFRNDWLLDGGRSALRDVPDAAHALARIARADHEIERKFLLRAAPPHALAAPGIRIAQGWLPGEQLRERLRRSVHPEGRVEWTRTVKVGTGVSRIEIEEQTEPLLFESLWPLTAHARVEKVRHTVADGAYTWEIDVFLDRELVLAEVELPSSDTLVTLPDWLAPYLVRDVTGDAAYVNANLARNRSRPATHA